MNKIPRSVEARYLEDPEVLGDQRLVIPYLFDAAGERHAAGIQDYDFIGKVEH